MESRRSDDETQVSQPGGYEPPQVEDVPATDGPAATAAGVDQSPPTDDGPEWRPVAPETDEGGDSAA